MRKVLTILLSVLFFAASAQDAKKVLSPKAFAKSDDIEVTYGQPAKKGRVIFGGLVPYNSVWRTGANEATEILFKTDVMFGGKRVKAGRYTLFTIPSENSWEIILNKQLGQWGAYEYEKYKRKNVLRTKVETFELPDVLENFTISVTKDYVSFEWDRTGVAVPVKALQP